MEKNKYKIIPDLFGIKIIRLNIEDGTENKTITYNAFEELTDEELEKKIQEFKMKGLEVEMYHQRYFRGKVKSVKD